eukprot:6392668-Pyramimonas_sp.AAC.1
MNADPPSPLLPAPSVPPLPPTPLLSHQLPFSDSLLSEEKAKMTVTEARTDFVKGIYRPLGRVA